MARQNTNKNNTANKKQIDLDVNREDGTDQFLTTNQGLRINDNQNSLKAYPVHPVKFPRPLCVSVVNPKSKTQNLKPKIERVRLFWKIALGRFCFGRLIKQVKISFSLSLA